MKLADSLDYDEINPMRNLKAQPSCRNGRQETDDPSQQVVIGDHSGPLEVRDELRATPESPSHLGPREHRSVGDSDPLVER